MPVSMKDIIADTYAAMIRQKGVDKITVKALIQECGISRQTFYYHFQDLMEVIEWSVQRAMEHMLEQSLQASTPREAMEIFVSSSLKNRAMLFRLLDSNRREQVEVLIVKAIRSYLEEMIRNRAPQMTLNYQDLEALLDFYSFGVTGLLLKSCAQKLPDEALLADQMYRLLAGQMLSPAAPETLEAK